MIKRRSEGWEYKHFNDREVITFFQEHPIAEFPNVINKFFRLIMENIVLIYLDIIIYT